MMILLKTILDGDITTTIDPNASTKTDTTTDPNVTITTDPNGSSTPDPDNWEEYDMIWSVDQCPELIWFNGITLSECQAFCESMTSCTAINFGNNHCTLLKCAKDNNGDCPDPLWSAANYKGYCLKRGNQ